MFHIIFLIALAPFRFIIHQIIAIRFLFRYWYAIWFYIKGGSYDGYKGEYKSDLHAKTHLFALGLILKLWKRPHYRTGTFQEDLLNNLRNTAIPGTGMALSFWARSRLLTKIFLFVVYPFVNMLVAILNTRFTCLDLSHEFNELLVHPVDWFTLWRMNCALASYHSSIDYVEGYDLENKWVFLEKAKNEGFPVSEWESVKGVVVRDSSKNEEGTMFFQSVENGGDWIIQKKLHNSEFLKEFLPETAPLSTIRVVTGWKCENDISEQVIAFSSVLRAGLANAETDHVSILFDVDMITGHIKKGTTNNHWYQLGIKKLGNRPWYSEHNIVSHPDSKKRVTDRIVPNIQDIIKLTIDAHTKLLPHVPLAGWDIVLTEDSIKILEVNLSCNFFRGTVNLEEYFKFINQYFLSLSNPSKVNKKFL